MTMQQQDTSSGNVGAPGAAGQDQGAAAGTPAPGAADGNKDGAQGAAPADASAGAAQGEAAGAKPAEAKPAEGDKPTDAKEGDKPAGPPDAYQFKAPEGLAYTEATTKAFADVAKEAGLSQEAAQTIYSKMGTFLAQKQAADVAAVHDAWAAAAKGDKEIGGDKLDATVADAKAAVQRFGGDAATRALNETGLGNHPEIIRMMARIGRAIKEDTLEGAAKGEAGKEAPKTLGQALYGNK